MKYHVKYHETLIEQRYVGVTVRHAYFKAYMRVHRACISHTKHFQPKIIKKYEIKITGTKRGREKDLFILNRTP